MLTQLLLGVFSLVLFSIKGIITLDPDFGWHIKMGQLILSSGIPHVDPFSYTMASFPFVDHEWLTNVFFSLYDKTALAVFFSLVATASLFIALKPKTNPIFKFFLLTLAVAAILPFAGIRPQVLSWLFLAILLRGKLRYLLPLFFFLWANLHGSFAVGLATLVIILVVKSIRLRKVKITDLLLVIASGLATLINPYGIRLWGEVVMQLTDSNLRWTIQEWMPSLLVLNLAFIFLASLSTILIFKFRNKFLLEELVIYAAFLCGALSSVRNIPLWVIVSLPLVSKGFGFLEKEITTIPKGPVRLQKSLYVALIMSAAILGVQMFFTFRSPLNESTFYPSGGVNFLKIDIPQGNIFSDYGWGGYLIWQLPEKRLFIDGRMPSWRYQNCPSNESCNAMQDYRDITTGVTNYQHFFTKYHITTVLVAVPGKPNLMDQLVAFITKKPAINFSLADKLTQDGWKKVYEDKVSDILQK